jgi:hypothetical protein
LHPVLPSANLNAILLGGPAVAAADTLRVPVGQQAQSQTEIQRPTNGMSKTRVSELFGEPVNKTPAVGEPPISSWEYPGYVVYFEGNTALHSVLKHQPVSSSQ